MPISWSPSLRLPEGHSEIGRLAKSVYSGIWRSPHVSDIFSDVSIKIINRSDWNMAPGGAGKGASLRGAERRRYTRAPSPGNARAR